MNDARLRAPQAECAESGNRAVLRPSEPDRVSENDSTLKVWDLETGLPLVRLHCDASLRRCTCAGGGKIIAGDAGGRLYFLLFESGLDRDGQCNVVS
jgi:hypothetical protein